MGDYLTFWQTDQAVFHRELEAHELYFSPAQRARMERLLVQCRRPHGLILLLGASGTGKSTLLKWLYSTLEVAKYEVLLTSLVREEKTMGWLTPRLAEFMGVPLTQQHPPSDDPTPAIRRTATALDELIAEDRRLLVAVDAAHHLHNTEACGELSAFLNLQTLAGSCLSFVLAGDLRLRPIIQAVPELKTRVVTTLELAPCTLAETTAYLQHRLKLAAVSAEFAPEALDLLHNLSGGLLATIDNLAESCLMEAAFGESRQISRTIVHTAAVQIFGSAAEVLPGLGSLKSSDFGLGSSQSPNLAKGASLPMGPAPGDAGVPPGSGAEGTGIKLTSLFKSEPARKRS